MTMHSFSKNSKELTMTGKPKVPTFEGLTNDDILVYCEIHRNTRSKSYKKNRSVGRGNMSLSEIATTMRHRYQVQMGNTYKSIEKLKTYEGNSLLQTSEVKSNTGVMVAVVSTTDKFPQFKSAETIDRIQEQKKKGVQAQFKTPQL